MKKHCDRLQPYAGQKGDYSALDDGTSLFTIDPAGEDQLQEVGEDYVVIKSAEGLSILPLGLFTLQTRQ